MVSGDPLPPELGRDLPSNPSLGNGQQLGVETVEVQEEELILPVVRAAVDLDAEGEVEEGVVHGGSLAEHVGLEVELSADLEGEVGCVLVCEGEAFIVRAVDEGRGREGDQRLTFEADAEVIDDTGNRDDNSFKLVAKDGETLDIDACEF